MAVVSFFYHYGKFLPTLRLLEVRIIYINWWFTQSNDKENSFFFRSSVFIVKWQGSCQIHIQGPYRNWQNCKYIYFILKSAEDCTCKPLVSLLKLLLSTVILTGDDSWLLKPCNSSMKKNNQNNQLSFLKNHKK